MRIAYIARHGQVNSNDDEGAIAYALRKLGHDVMLLSEGSGHAVYNLRPDLVLFHKWSDTNALRRLPTRVKKVFWYFDLVEFPDSSLETRNSARRSWMESVTPVVDLGFCTDGDWVAKDSTGKLVWLPQGADERVIGPGRFADSNVLPSILFTGIGRAGGVGRGNFVQDMMDRYGGRFRQVARGVYGRRMADLISQFGIVVAPDAPITDRYWSNRVYLCLGFGAFLLHPKCVNLLHHYQDAVDIVYYSNRKELHSLIEHYSEQSEKRKIIANSGVLRTFKEHTYRHRCEILLSTVKDRLG